MRQQMGLSQQHFAFLLGIDRGMLSMAEIGSRSLPSVHQFGLPIGNSACKQAHAPVGNSDKSKYTFHQTCQGVRGAYRLVL